MRIRRLTSCAANISRTRMIVPPPDFKNKRGRDMNVTGMSVVPRRTTFLHAGESSPLRLLVTSTCDCRAINRKACPFRSHRTGKEEEEEDDDEE